MDADLRRVIERLAEAAGYLNEDLPDFPEDKWNFLLQSASEVSSDDEAKAAVLYMFLLRGYLRLSAEGHAFVDEQRVAENFGRSVRANYPEANDSFIKFATSYWTFKLWLDEAARCFSGGEDPLVLLLLRQLEQDLASLFFPTPGPIKIPPAEREQAQREFLAQFRNLPIEVDDLMKGNAILMRDRKVRTGYAGVLMLAFGALRRMSGRYTMRFFDALFGITPTWAKQLPSHLRPSADQVKRLEAIRREVGTSHEEFFLHIVSHPKTTKKLQRHMYTQARKQQPGASEQDLLVAVLFSRLASAQQQGTDLFGLSLVPPDQIEARIHQIAARYSNIEALAEAIVAEEMKEPAVGPAPGFEDAATRVSKILAV